MSRCFVQTRADKAIRIPLKYTIKYLRKRKQMYKRGGPPHTEPNAGELQFPD